MAWNFPLILTNFGQRLQGIQFGLGFGLPVAVTDVTQPTSFDLDMDADVG